MAPAIPSIADFMTRLMCTQDKPCSHFKKTSHTTCLLYSQNICKLTVTKLLHFSSLFIEDYTSRNVTQISTQSCSAGTLFVNDYYQRILKKGRLM